MPLAAPAVASFEWTVDAARELIRFRRDNHDDFDTDIDLILVRIIDPILMVILRIVDPILAVIIHEIIDHIPAIIQGIIDPISEDTEGSHILHEREVFH
ncbi:14967_t:CDS:2 [Funneliformis geosporum]|nr:14967_t:CDS:2 [Funneliformis geosporum]